MRVISGGQTGCDIAALRAARACGIETGGFAPLGWSTEAGPNPALADYGLEECSRPGYAARRTSNVALADAILLLGDPWSNGSAGLLRDAHRAGKPVLICSRVHEGKAVELEVGRGEVVTWVVYGTDEHFAWMFLSLHDVGTLMVAGNRESLNPGIEKAAQKWLERVFRLWRGD